MHIGAVAKTTGASAKAIRLYEELGLLPAVRRRGAYRIYSAEHVQLIRWIRQAQGLGFKLAELDVLRSVTSNADWGLVAELIQAKRQRITAEMTRLQAIERGLSALAEELHGCEQSRSPVSACP